MSKTVWLITGAGRGMGTDIDLSSSLAHDDG